MNNIDYYKNKCTKISVIIPCYNLERYLDDCLESFINQTYENFEVICVDDGSTDATAEIVSRYAQQDERFMLIGQKNLYAGVARNNGMKKAEGDYLLFFDGDDFCDEDMLLELVSRAERFDADIVLCDADCYNNSSKKFEYNDTFLRTMYIKDFEERGYFSYRDLPNSIFEISAIAPWNKLYKRSFIEDNGIEFQNTKRCNDAYFTLISMIKAQKISWVDRKLVHYRIGNPLSLQGYKDIDEDFGYISAPWISVKKELEKSGLYDAIKDGFTDKCLITFRYALNKLKSYRSFSKAYDLLRSASCNILYFDENTINRYFCGSEAEYLFERLMDSVISGGEKYVLPFEEIGNHSVIGIYGAGGVGKAYYRQLKGDSRFTISGWYDREYEKQRKLGFDVSSPDDIDCTKSEMILIALSDKKVADDVREMLRMKGFKDKDIIWKI